MIHDTKYTVTEKIIQDILENSQLIIKKIKINNILMIINNI